MNPCVILDFPPWWPHTQQILSGVIGWKTSREDMGEERVYLGVGNDQRDGRRKWNRQIKKRGNWVKSELSKRIREQRYKYNN